MNNNLKGFAYGIATLIRGHRLIGYASSKKGIFQNRDAKPTDIDFIGCFLYRLGNVPVLGL